MSSATGQESFGKGTVARMVDRLSKQDFSALAARAENVPLRSSRGVAIGLGGGGDIGVVGEPLMASAVEGGVDGGCDMAAEQQPLSEERAFVRFSYAAQQPDELDLKEGDELEVLELVEDGWARGRIVQSVNAPHMKGRTGLYPTNFVSTVSPTPTTQTAPVTTHSELPSSLPHPIRAEDKQPQDCPGPGLSLSTSAPKTTTPPLLTNGSGVVHAGNLLPSSLLKPQTGVGSSGARRAVSTLISSTPSAENTAQTKPKELAKVLYKYEASNSDELTLPEGTVVNVVIRQCEDEGWFIAEHEGRRGLFPDNFVRFFEQGHSQTPTNTHPPSLPAKPSKFGAGSSTISASSAAPAVVTRDSLAKITANFKTPPTDAQLPEASLVENPNTTAPKLPLSNTLTSQQKSTSSTTTSANRRSVIEGLQKQLFPSGKLPPQRLPQSQRSPIGSSAGEQFAEPKPNIETDGEEAAPALLVDNSIVKSRTTIAPLNKRPPSKVNSAAALVTPDSPVSEEAPRSPLSTPVTNNKEAAITPPPFVVTTTAQINTGSSNKSTVFSTQNPPSPGSSLCGSHPTPLLCAITEEQQRSSVSSAGGKHFRAQQPPPTQQSPSQCGEWISRAEFDRYKEEAERKHAALQAEVVELRRRLDAMGQK